MSEYVGEAFVKITPDARNFTPELDKQIRGMTPSAQGLLGRSGIGSQLKETDKVGRQYIGTLQQVAAGEQAVAQQAEKLATAHEGVAIHAHRANIAGFALRGSTVALGAAALIGVEGLHALAEQLKVTGTEADTVTGSLRNAAAAAASGDFAGAAVQLGQAASADLNRSLADEATAATARDKQRQDAIALATTILDLREKVAKAEGTVGTAAGRTTFQYEKQLKISEAAYKALAPNLQRIAAGQFNLRPDLSNKVRVAPTDASRQSDFELSAIRAAQTKTSRDDREILAVRDKGLRGQIAFLEAAGAHTQAAKDRLKTLYGQLDSVEGQLQTLDDEAAAKRQQRLQNRLALAQTTLQIQAANARTDAQENAALAADASFARTNAENKNLDAQSRAGYALQAAQDDKSIFQAQQAAAAAARSAAEEAKRAADEKRKQLAQEHRDAEEKAAQARQTIRQTGELRLENAIASASLTKSTADDKKAINVAIAYYRNLVRTTRGLQQEQARSQVIALRGQLRNVGSNDSSAPRSSASDFFREAASQFRSFGSNISTSGGILSGQDARGAFAARALQSGGIQQTMANQAQQTRNAALVEAQKSNVYLKTIADRVTYSGAEKDPPAKGIANARRGAHVVQAAQ